MAVEIVGNLHLHTLASDGTGTHAEVAAAAAKAGLDFIVYTDHNAWVDDQEGWYQDPGSGRNVLCLMGQEVNDTQLNPECNHLLTFFVKQDLQPLAANPQKLLDYLQTQGSPTFLAHPLERPGMDIAKSTYPWVSWDISGFTGIELWNAMSDVKWQLRSMPRGIIGAYLPHIVLSAPFPEVLAKWDELLATGRKIVAIGNSDAHAMSFSVGILRRTIYPYVHTFRAVNTHILLDAPLSEDLEEARLQIRQGLTTGRCFVAYDAVAQCYGFSFTGTSGLNQAQMGETLTLDEMVTLSIDSPRVAHLRLIKDGRLIAEANDSQLTWQTSQPGVYRVEAYRRFWGQKRGWVFTNPIYIETETSP